MDNLIIHDDNHGPYFSLPTKYLEDKDPYIIVVSPYAVKIFGHMAEMFAAQELYKWIIKSLSDNKAMPSCIWMDYFKHYFNRKALILRTMLIQKSDYLSHLDKLKKSGEDVIRLIECSKKLPEYFWLVEISLPELFPVNRKKIGEILINPNIPDIPENKPNELNWSLALESVRLPGIFMNFITGSSNNRTIDFHHDVPKDPLPLMSKITPPGL